MRTYSRAHHGRRARWRSCSASRRCPSFERCGVRWAIGSTRSRWRRVDGVVRRNAGTPVRLSVGCPAMGVDRIAEGSEPVEVDDDDGVEQERRRINPPHADVTLESLLTFVKETRGFDFTGYKRSTIERRVAKRLSAVGAERYDDYLDYLEMHGEEFAELFNALLINTTGFFRDPQTWDYIADEVVPQLLSAREPEEPVRVWCAGCASGEEPYTVAMVLARVMGDVRFRERVKIYATDVDEEALDYARHGAYLPREIEDVPHDALERYFERTDQRYVFRKDLRRSVIFGRNDLVQ